MKITEEVNRLRLAFFLAVMLMMPATAFAQLTWGNSGTGGTGTWDSTTLDWYDGSSNVAWVAGDAATFAGTAGTVALSGTQTASQLTFSNASGSYTLTGGMLEGASSALTIEADSDAVINSPIEGLVLLTKTGAGTLTLTGTNNFSATAIQNGGIIVDSSSPISGETFTLGSGSTSGYLQLGDSSSAANLTLTSLLASGGGTSNAVVGGNSSTASVLTVNNTGSDTFAGQLGGSTATSQNLELIKAGSGTLDLTGINTYTGSTTVSGGNLQVGGGGSIGGMTGTALTLGSGTNSNQLILGDNSGVGSATVSSITISGTGTANAVIGGNSSNSTLTINTSTTTGSFAGAIGGSGVNNNNLNLIKTGSGTFNLSGFNYTYSGTTSVQQGTLEVAVLGAAFSPATAVVLGNGSNSGVLQLGNSFVAGDDFISGLSTSGTGTANAIVGGSSITSTLVYQSVTSGSFAGTIGGTGTNNNNLSLLLFTEGTLDLTGNSTYTGPTGVDFGNLQIGGGGSIGGTSGTALSIGYNTTGGNQLILGDSSGIGTATLSSLTVYGTGTGYAVVGGNSADSNLIITGSGSSTFTGAIGGTGTNNNNINLIKNGSGSFEVSSAGATTYTGTTTINAGTLIINTTSSTSMVTVNGGALLLATGGSVASASGVNLTASGATFDISNGGNQTIQDLSGVSGTTVYLGENTLTEGTSNSTSFAGTLLGSPGSGFIKQGTGTLTFTGQILGGLWFGFNGGIFNSGTSGDLSTSSGISFGGGTLQYSAADKTDYSGSIVDSTGAISIDTNGQNVTFAGALPASNIGGLTKLGTGTLTLSGSNQYTGTTTLGGGTLGVTNAGALNSTGNITFTGGTLLYSTANTVDYSSRIVNSSSAITLDIGGTTNLTYASALAASNSGGLTKTGAGTLTLTGSNLYTGTTTIAQGTINLGNAGALNSTGNITFARGGINGGILQYSNANQVDYSSRIVNSVVSINIDTNGQNVTYASALAASNSAGLDKLGAGTLTFTGNNAYLGTTTISAGTIQVGGGGTTGSLGSGNVNDSGSLIYDRSDSVTNSSTISGVGTLTQAGGGTLTLSGANTYSGGTTFAAGILNAGSAGALGSTGNLVFTGGTLQYSAANSTDYSSRIVNSSSAIAVDTNGQNATYSGALAASNSGGLTKLGLGILSLEGDNAYTGGTMVSGGKLAINGSVLGNVTVQSGAEVGGDGAVAGIIGGSGAVGPGNSPGILTASATDPTGGLSYNFELTQAGAATWSNAAASGNDVLHLTSGTPFTNALTSANDINLYFSLNDTTYEGGFFVDGSDSLTANLADATFNYYLLDAGGAYTYNGNNYDLVTNGITASVQQILVADFSSGTVSGYTEQFTIDYLPPVAAPEPSTWAMLLGNLALLAFWRFRTRWTRV